MKNSILILFFSAFAWMQVRPASRGGLSDWTAHGGGPEQTHYSKLDQINTNNVSALETAWTYETGDAFQGSEMQCNPIVVNGVLYATSPKLRVFALDASTGKLRWSFDPPGASAAGKVRNRGLTYWTDGKDSRILVPAPNHLYALDARTV